MTPTAIAMLVSSTSPGFVVQGNVIGEDPAGNRICLFYGGEIRKNPPWKVKA